jgi:hypothetical protein
MKLTHLFKTDISAGGNCPAVYGTDDGSLVIQGWDLAPDDAAQLIDRAHNESGVKIPYDLAEKIADMVIAKRSA